MLLEKLNLVDFYKKLDFVKVLFTTLFIDIVLQSLIHNFLLEGGAKYTNFLVFFGKEILEFLVPENSLRYFIQPSLLAILACYIPINYK